MRNLSDLPPSDPDRTPANPFIDDTYVDRATTLPGVPEIHTAAMSQCVRLFESLVRDGERGQHWGNSGRTILIAAPRAGYGKSHLIGRLRSVTESLVAAMTLPFDPSRTIGWPVMLASVLRQYQDSRCPQHVGCSLMDETARFFLSNILQAAIAEGSIQEKDLPETEVSLRLHYRDVMAPNSGTKILPWIRKRLPELSAAAGRPMSTRWKLTERAIAFWGGVFLDQTEGHSDSLGALRGLTPGESRERTLQFLRISTECRPAAFVADNLDGFFGSDTAGMEIAEILTSLRAEVPRSLTLLCLNDDVWDSVFEKRLPSAWLDRLTGEPANLGGIGIEPAMALISGRVQAMGIPPESARKFANYVRTEERWDDPETPALYPRDVIRCARKQWECVGTRFSGTPQTQAPPAPPTSPVVPPQPAPAPVAPTPQQPPAQPFQQPNVQQPPAQRPSLSPIFSQSKPLPEPAANPIASQIKHQQRQQEEIRSRTTPKPPVTPPPPAAPKNPVPQDPAPAPAQNFQPQQTPPPPSSPARNLTGINSIIEEIRGAGGRAVSDTGAMPSQQPKPLADIPSQFQAGMLNVQSVRPQPPVPANPFAANEPEQRLQDMEMELLTADSSQMPWDLRRIEKLIRVVGRQHSAVGQREEAVPGSEHGCLRWTVKGQTVLLGFEVPGNAYFWNTLLKRAVASSDPAKLTVLSNTAEPFDAQTLASFGIDQVTAMRYLDVVEISEGDLALLYASERFLDEAESAGETAGAIQIIARRLDPFWRRLTRPMAPSTTAG